MSILVNKDTRLVVQGITGRDGEFHTLKMKAYGTNIVAGVAPGKGGKKVDEIPVYDSVIESVEKQHANTSIIFVPALFAADAIAEASEAGIKLVVAITEGIPTLDIIRIIPILRKNQTTLIGPNCPGLISPEESLVGILPGNIFKKGNIGLISRSGTLTYEIVNQLTISGLGQTTCIGIGGDPVIGSTFIDILEKFKDDKQTKAIVLIGEIGGDAEEKAGAFIKNQLGKPAVAFIAGRSAPPGKRMGHAGAIISSGSGTAEEKIKVLNSLGIPVANEPEEIPFLLKKIM